jgi:hypothetical protein
VKLYRPVGQGEWDKIEASGRRAFPPRFDFQPIFYPVLVLEYARKIARDWNTIDAASGYVGIVTEFDVEGITYPVQVVGDETCQEWWVPAEELPTFNAAIRGEIRALETYRATRL